MNYADIKYRIGVNTDHFVKGIRETKHPLMNLKNAVAGIVSVAALRGASRQFGEILSDLDKIAKMSSRVGLTTDALQELRFAGEQTGVATQALDIGMQRFARRIAEVAAGADNDLAKVLKANNIALKDGNGNLRDQVDILGDYANLIQRAGNEQDRTRLAFLAFDSEGVALVNTLKDGKDGLDEMRKSARDLGVVIDKDAIAAAERMNDRYNEILSSLSAKFKGFVVNTADGFNHLLNDLNGSNSVNDLNRRLSDLIARREEVVNQGTGIIPALFGDSADEVVERIDDNIARLQAQLADVDAFNRGVKERRNSNNGNNGSPTVIPEKPTAEQVAAERKAEARRKQLARDAAAQARAYEEVVRSLEIEFENLSLSSQQQRINNELRRAGVDIASDEGRRIAELVTVIDAENAARERTTHLLDELEQRQEAIRESQEYLIQSAADVAGAFTEGADEGIEALKKLGIQILATAAQARLLGTGPLAGLIPQSGFGGFAAFGSTGGSISPLASAALAAGRGGLFAKGGITHQPAIFGEAGPEAAVPLPDGRSIPVTIKTPNFAGIAQQHVSVHLTSHVDARGADASSVDRLQKALDERDRRFSDNVLAVFNNARSRGLLQGRD
jgi:hypothetical protein